MVAISHIYSFNLGSVRKLSHLNKKIGLLLSTPPKHSSEATSSEVKPKNWWEEMILAILEALPLAMRTPSPEMDPSKVIHNPPSFIKPGTASSFRRAHHTESAWKTQDVIDAFNAKYGVGVPIEAIATSGASAHSQPAGQSKAALVELLVCY